MDQVSFWGFDKDVFLCLSYVSPESSTLRDNIWCLSNSFHYQLHCSDRCSLNATHYLLVTLICTFLCRQVILLTTPSQRYYLEHNKYGRVLLDLCIADQLCIINGCIKPDCS